MPQHVFVVDTFIRNSILAVDLPQSSFYGHRTRCEQDITLSSDTSVFIYQCSQSHIHNRYRGDFVLQTSVILFCIEALCFHMNAKLLKMIDPLSISLTFFVLSINALERVIMTMYCLFIIEHGNQNVKFYSDKFERPCLIIYILIEVSPLKS
jgi:hypothetical protein